MIANEGCKKGIGVDYTVPPPLKRRITGIGFSLKRCKSDELIWLAGDPHYNGFG